ncbi:ABC transporter permease [Belliella kenyensis]|uniref:ABC transporter permease n=1 Tax=Belliella kenyensis TaxID=1472724 RepID=A0ABV8EPU8_9BACT|nr:FtsX-like permease family protein [Belliella kenyensis]MCH7403595.1 FtsX-like permease family protein [Belliella kenyensis]MDN3603853.1 FtsX-like permease family protein [Belliella kenyensis]
MSNFAWGWSMALRDFRRNFSRLTLFVSSMVVGIAALVAISSFGDNLKSDIENQSKELVGADLVLENNKPLDIQAPDSLAVRQADEVNFASMVLFPKSGDSRLTQVRMLEGEYPFYGALETIPDNATEVFRSGGKKALVEKVLMAQFNAAVGDSIKVGDLTFEIVGELQKVPGQTGITATVAPAVYIPLEYGEATGLIQFGSRLRYVRYYQFEESINVDELVERFETQWEEEKVSVDTVEERRKRTGRSFDNLASFLSLVAFIALLLGCVGVASAVNVFVKEKLSSVAVLRCLGVSSWQALQIYMMQILIMGFFGAVLGAALGSVLQYVLPVVFVDFLPVEVSVSLSWKSIGLGIITGMLVAFLFALLPLLKMRKVSPMATLRPEEGEVKVSRDPLRWMVILGILLFVFGFSYSLLGDWKAALGFTGFVIFSFGVLWSVALMVMWVIRRFLPISLSYPVRQSLANLYRPNNQTTSLIATIGLGTAMISTLFFVQGLLLEEAKFADKEDQPNMLLFDIQDHQIESVVQKVKAEGIPVLQQVPIVTIGLEAINGLTKKANDTLPEEEQRSRSLYNREFRVTYRDTLTSSERLVKGSLRKVNSQGDSVFVSFDQSYALRTGLSLGDEIIFNVQGRPIKTYIGSFRDVKFNQVSTNFLVLFPEGVLERAPKFHVVITKTKNDRQAAQVQSNIVRSFPNVSVVNLGAIVETLEEILGKISFVIQFMAFFSIATGILVLISSLIISKYQRMRESILLRTLGADSSTVRKINTLEYFFLGSLASLSGIVLSFLATYLLSKFVFQIPFRGAFEEAFVVYLCLTLLTILLGWLNGRQVINKPPMEILRSNG